MLSRIKTFLQAKILSYRLNAYVDAQIATKLTKYLKINQIPRVKNEAAYRANNFIILASKYKKPKQSLVVIAYSLERYNGLVNYVYSGLIQKIFFLSSANFPDIVKINPYLNDPTSLYSLTYTWIKLLLRQTDDITKYAENNGINLTLNRKQIVRAIKLVQHQNAKYNAQIAKILQTNKKSNKQKIKIIRQAAKKSDYPQIFINCAAKTQISAAKWDKHFIRLLLISQ